MTMREKILSCFQKSFLKRDHKRELCTEQNRDSFIRDKKEITDSLSVCLMPRINKSPGFHISPSLSEHILVRCDPRCRTPDESTHNNRGSGPHKTEELTISRTPVSPVSGYLCGPVTPSHHEENIISINLCMF